MSFWTSKSARCLHWQIMFIQMSANLSWHNLGKFCGCHVHTASSTPRKLSCRFFKLPQKSVNRYPKEYKSAEQNSYIVHTYHPLSKA